MTIRVEIDWNRSGFGGSIDDVSGRVRRSSAISVDYGRDQTTAQAPTVAGRGSMVLDNVDRALSPRNTASPFYGYLKPSRPVRITREFGTPLIISNSLIISNTLILANLDTYVLFDGHTDDNPINPDVDAKTASVSMVDNLADFRGVNVTTSLYSGIRTGEAINYILDAAGWSGSLRDIDAGSTVIPWFWVDNKDALEALEEVLRSEGPPAMLTIGVNGAVVFKDRHHRFIDSASLTSQATWRDTGAEPLMNKPFTYDEAWRNIVNTGTVNVDVRTPSAEDAVWTLDSAIGFGHDETKTFIASTSDPFLNAVAPVSGVDFTVTSGTIESTALVRTSGASTTISIKAGVGGAQIDRLQLRAQPVQVAYTVQVTASDAASITDYGQRSFPGDLPWCNQYDAQAILDTAIQMRAQPLPIVQTRFVIGRNTTRAAAILTRDLSDRVTIVETQTVLNGDFYLEAIGHEATGDHDHAVTVGLEAVPPTGAVTPANIFLVGGGAGHQIGDGVLAA